MKTVSIIGTEKVKLINKLHSVENKTDYAVFLKNATNFLVA
jgi:hypothetical protein